MRISVFGLGYVGSVTAAWLADAGHEVIGVDVAPEKVARINAGQAPVCEPGVDELLATAVAERRLRASLDGASAVAATEMAIVCVGTPSGADAELGTTYVKRVARQIGEALRGRSEHFTLVLRSTLLPGTTRSCILPIFREASGRALGESYDLLYHPEFLREGSSLRDFERPALIVVGADVPATAERLLGLYRGIEAPKIVTTIEVAEAVKYASNAFHAVKITFANEIGQFCAAAGVDSQAVMEVFCQDDVLNISPTYLRPGFAWGGSCLPKDLRALLKFAERSGVALPMLRNAMASNLVQIEAAVRRIEGLRPGQIGLVGIAFKPGTDDLRESQLVELAERLMRRGYPLRVYDPAVASSQLTGRNRAHIEERLPELPQLLVRRLEELDGCEPIVIGHHLVGPAVIGRWLAQGKTVLDLMGPRPETASAGKYIGLYW